MRSEHSHQNLGDVKIALFFHKQLSEIHRLLHAQELNKFIVQYTKKKGHRKEKKRATRLISTGAKEGNTGHLAPDALDLGLDIGPFGGGAA